MHFRWQKESVHQKLMLKSRFPVNRKDDIFQKSSDGKICARTFIPRLWRVEWGADCLFWTFLCRAMLVRSWGVVAKLVVLAYVNISAIVTDMDKVIGVLGVFLAESYEFRVYLGWNIEKTGLNSDFVFLKLGHVLSPGPRHTTPRALPGFLGSIRELRTWTFRIPKSPGAAGLGFFRNSTSLHCRISPYKIFTWNCAVRHNYLKQHGKRQNYWKKMPIIIFLQR